MSFQFAASAKTTEETVFHDDFSDSAWSEAQWVFEGDYRIDNGVLYVYGEPFEMTVKGEVKDLKLENLVVSFKVKMVEDNTWGTHAVLNFRIRDVEDTPHFSHLQLQIHQPRLLPKR